MKKLFTIVLFVSAYFSYSQTVTFEYDAAGNQVRRVYTSTLSRMAQPESKEYKQLVQNDFQKFFPEDVISYYPNPVKEELFLKWELQADKKVLSIDIYNVNGQFLQNGSIQNDNTTTISFSQYTSGTYIVNLKYDNGEQKSITIIKQ